MKDPSLDCPNKQPRQKRCDCDTCIAREVKEYGEPVLDWARVCQVCGELDCRQSVAPCAKCEEDHHEDSALCGDCDAEEMDLEDRLDAYLHDGYDRARDAAGER